MIRVTQPELLSLPQSYLLPGPPFEVTVLCPELDVVQAAEGDGILVGGLQLHAGPLPTGVMWIAGGAPANAAVSPPNRAQRAAL